MIKKMAFINERDVSVLGEESSEECKIVATYL